MNKITETLNIFIQQLKGWLHWLMVLMCLITCIYESPNQCDLLKECLTLNK